MSDLQVDFYSSEGILSIFVQTVLILDEIESGFKLGISKGNELVYLVAENNHKILI